MNLEDIMKQLDRVIFLLTVLLLFVISGTALIGLFTIM